MSRAVQRAVSALTDTTPQERADLNNVLDPDALDALFGPQADGSARRGGELTFVYNGCRVTVNNGEYLTVRRLATRTSTGDG